MAHLQAPPLFRRHIAVTNEHGSWVFFLSPLLIGLYAGGGWTVASAYLVGAALAAFLVRHPITIAVKVFSGRRSRRDLPAAMFWTGIYSALGLLMVAGLLIRGYGYLLLLVIPGIPIFAWHLWLVSRRSERRQMGVEIVASGVLALVAPAAMWVGRGFQDPDGWWLWGLVWFQSAASIVYAYLRLEQRAWGEVPPWEERLGRGWRALLYTTFNLIVVSGLSLLGVLPPLLFLPYALQWLETFRGALQPAINVRPTAIGIRQLIVSTLFTLLFLLAWTR